MSFKIFSLQLLGKIKPVEKIAFHSCFLPARLIICSSLADRSAVSKARPPAIHRQSHGADYSLVSLPRRGRPFVPSDQAHRAPCGTAAPAPAARDAALDEGKRLTKLIRTHVLLATVRYSVAQDFESMRQEAPLIGFLGPYPEIGHFACCIR